MSPSSLFIHHQFSLLFHYIHSLHAYLPLLFPFSHLCYTLSFFSSHRSTSTMEIALENLKRTYPNMPRDILRLIYKYRLERSRVLIKYGLPRDMQEIIKARVRLAGELPSSLVKYLSGMRKSSYSKKRRTKRMKVCHKCTK